MPKPSEVTQADREAAADACLQRLVLSHGGEQGWMREAVNSMRKGEQDDHPDIQAFAAHRTLTQPPAEPSELVGAAEALLRKIEAVAYQEGADRLDYEDEQAALLQAWRVSRGDAGMDQWEWWCRPVDDHEYDMCKPTRQEIIDYARSEYDQFETIEIIEVRCWSDDIQADDAPFAQTRNREVLPQAIRAALKGTPEA